VVGSTVGGRAWEGRVEARKEAEAVRPVASVGLEEAWVGGGGDGTEAKVRAKEGFANEVGSAGEGGGIGGIRAGEVGDDGGIVEVEGSGETVNGVSDAVGDSRGDMGVVAAAVL
jgi:hypothetical protein